MANVRKRFHALLARVPATHSAPGQVVEGRGRAILAACGDQPIEAAAIAAGLDIS